MDITTLSSGGFVLPPPHPFMGFAMIGQMGARNY